ncbi:hypothetical protein [Mesorhizobium sp. YR577]|uniref:hypothetical protein n=1 Tax=Mesorhizobium sp. YR577 TaxID=1884373 RepID=UPI0008F3916D|nr:hypothetical protein [Mesorhizobium sp. YR577]SFU21943.1 hypothetical protein SAMN05518861_13034 [Mesorhizobium sp. YR577]
MDLIRAIPRAAGIVFAAEGHSAGTASDVAISDFHLSGVSLEHSTYKDERAFKMTMPSEAIQDAQKEKLSDRNFMAWLPMDFGDGVVEAEMASELAADAPAYARGFIGLTFRIDSEGRFESIYLRPTNSVADDQVRRNHSVQYVAYPDYRFDRLRSESPEKYESYAELDLGRWIHMRIVVSGQKAALYLDGKSQPALIVNDLKFGTKQRGGVGVWLESGTIAYFRNLKVKPA